MKKDITGIIRTEYHFLRFKNMKKDITGIIRTEYHCDILLKEVPIEKVEHVTKDGFVISKEAAKLLPKWFLEDKSRLEWALKGFGVQPTARNINDGKWSMAVIVNANFDGFISGVKDSPEGFSTTACEFVKDLTNFTTYAKNVVVYCFQDGVYVRRVYNKLVVEEVKTTVSVKESCQLSGMPAMNKPDIEGNWFGEGFNLTIKNGVFNYNNGSVYDYKLYEPNLFELTGRNQYSGTYKLDGDTLTIEYNLTNGQNMNRFKKNYAYKNVFRRV